MDHRSQHPYFPQLDIGNQYITFLDENLTNKMIGRNDCEWPNFELKSIIVYDC